MAAVCIMAGDGRVTGGTGVFRAGFRHIMTSGAINQGYWRVRGAVASEAAFRMMKSVQQTAINVTLAGGAAWVFCHIIVVQHIMESAYSLINMAVQTTVLTMVCDHLVHCPVWGSRVCCRVDVSS